jgi:hypothetical protein
MTLSADIRRAIETHLAAMDNVPVIAWENAAFTPDPDVPFLRARLSFERKAAALGVNAPQLWTGELQLTIHAPDKKGAGEADAVADELLAHFAIGSVISQGDVRVICNEATRSAGSNENGRYIVPATIGWRSYTGE